MPTAKTVPTITWKIEWMQALTSGVPGYVINCGWRCTGVQDKYSASVYASCAFTPPADDPKSLTPYDQLTEAQVLGWVWGSGVDKAATEAAVQQQINAQSNPPVVQPPLPWAK
jgi:hypothetical protein